MTRADIEQADDWFDAHGHLAVLFGRLVPTVRTLISIPAGLSEMPLRRFLLYSGIGTATWTTLLALLGYALGSEYRARQCWIDPVSYRRRRADRRDLSLARRDLRHGRTPQI